MGIFSGLFRSRDKPDDTTVGSRYAFLNLYRYNDDGDKEKVFDHPLYLLLHDEPNPEMTSFVFRETLMTHLLLWGCSDYPKW